MNIALGDISVTVNDYFVLLVELMVQRIHAVVGEGTEGRDSPVKQLVRHRRRRIVKDQKTMLIHQCLFKEFQILLTFRQTCHEQLQESFFSELGKALFSIENTSLAIERLEFLQL